MFRLLKQYIGKFVLLTALFGAAVFSVSLQAGGQPLLADDNQRAVTIHDGGRTLTVTTKARSVGEVLQRAGIETSGDDLVEPAVQTPLLSPAYTVNVYRARPVTISEGGMLTRVMSPHQSPRSVVADADMGLRDEDTVSLSRIDNFVSDGAPGLMVELDRATRVVLILYGKQAAIYTQAETVGQLLAEKGITLGKKDGISVPANTAIRANLTVDVYRDGVQTQTKELPVPFDTRQIQDANRDVGYRKVQTPGKNGKKLVTYQIVLKNGREVSRKVIQTVVTQRPGEEVVVVGAKPTFDGDFAAALAELRACEGGYDSWNPAGPYYGAYQFDQGTWASSAPPGAEYGNASPAEQDQAARNLYERRGWNPWPSCGAGLPDTFR